MRRYLPFGKTYLIAVVHSMSHCSPNPFSIASLSSQSISNPSKLFYKAIFAILVQVEVGSRP